MQENILKKMMFPLTLTLVDTTALIDKVTGSGRLAGIDVTNNNEVNVELFLTHLNKLEKPRVKCDEI